MAGPGLPASPTANVTTGHATHHAAIHGIANMFDTTPPTTVGQIPKWNGTVYAPGTDIVGTGSSYNGTGQIFVDPINGLDANAGTTWTAAKQTIAAAVSTATTGMEVMLAPGDYDLAGTKVTMTASKLLSIRGAKTLSTTQFSQTKSARILNSGALLSAYFETDHPSGSNPNGWHFADLYFECDGLANDGAAIVVHGTNGTRFHRIGARSLTQTPGTRWLVRSTGSDNIPIGTGGDHSWYVFRDIYVVGVKLFNGTGGSNNYQRFESCVVHGDATLPAGPAIDIDSGSSMFFGVNMEAWGKGIKLTNHRNAWVHVMGESVDVGVHLVDCYDSRVQMASFAGSGSRKGIDEITGTPTWDGGVNKWDGPLEVQVIGDGHRAEYSSYRTRAIQPQYVANYGIVPVYNDHPGLPHKPLLRLVEGQSGIDILAAVGLTLEYWNGSAWVSWFAVDTAGSNTLLIDDLSAVTITPTQQRFRIRTAAQIPVAGVLTAAIQSYAGGNTHTVTVRTQDAARATVLERVMRYGVDSDHTNPNYLSGFTAAVKGGVHIEVEGNFALSADNVSFRRLALIQAPWDVPDTYAGRSLTSRLSPEAAITAVVGTQCTVVQGANAGLWVKTSGSGNTGWTKLT